MQNQVLPLKLVFAYLYGLLVEMPEEEPAFVECMIQRWRAGQEAVFTDGNFTLKFTPANHHWLVEAEGRGSWGENVIRRLNVLANYTGPKVPLRNWRVFLFLEAQGLDVPEAKWQESATDMPILDGETMSYSYSGPNGQKMLRLQGDWWYQKEEVEKRLNYLLDLLV